MAVLGTMTRLRRVDWGLVAATSLLLAFGLAAIISLKLNAPQPDLTLFYRQLIFAGIGVVALIVTAIVDYRFFRSAAWLLYGAAILTLSVVLIVGTTIRGTRGWFEVLGQTFQPVELVKIVLIIALARVLADRFDERAPLKSLVLTGLLVAPLVALVFAQNDLGSVLMLLAIWVAMLFLVRLPARYFLGLLAVGAVVAVLAWFVVLKGYQQERIRTFFNPARDPLGIGYNLRQAKVAVGSGQLVGRGLGLGPQSQLDFLPVQETDFIFAVIGEELGFVGSVLVFGLYGFFFVRLVRIVRASTDDFAALLVGGIAALLFVQSVMNISMNIGLLPVAGLPLPFLSYGGSALISSLIMVGLVESVAIRSRGERVAPAWSQADPR